MPKRRTFRVELDWGITGGADSRLVDFAIYGTTAMPLFVKGARLAVVSKEARHAELKGIDEGLWTFRVVPRGVGGAEPGFNTQSVAKVEIRVNAGALPAPSPIALAPAIGPTEPAGGGVLAEPITGNKETGGVIQVIQGPDEFTGKLVGEQAIPNSAMDSPGGEELLGERALPPFPFVGYGQDVDRTYYAVTRDGEGRMSGTPAVVTSFMPDMDDAGDVAIGSMIADGATITFLGDCPDPAGSPPNPWENDITDGLRLRTIPTRAGAVGIADWEDKDKLLKDVQRIACYLPAATYELIESDLGSVQRGVLDVYDETQRKSSTFPPGFDGPMARCTFTRPEDQAAILNTGRGPEWWAHMVRSDGKPLQPLRDVRWYIKTDVVTPIVSAYRPLQPMEVIKCRYFRLLLTVTDLGFWQIKIPKIIVRFRPKYQIRWGIGNYPGGGAPTHTITLGTGNPDEAVDRVTALTPFPRSSAIICTPFLGVANIRMAVTLNNLPGALPANFVVTAQDDVTGAFPAVGFSFYWIVIGY